MMTAEDKAKALASMMSSGKVFDPKAYMSLFDKSYLEIPNHAVYVSNGRFDIITFESDRNFIIYNEALDMVVKINDDGTITA